MGELTTHIDRKAFPAVLIQDREHPEPPPIPRPVMHKVIAPNMILMLRTKSNTGSIIQPQPPPFRLTLRDLQPLLPPQSFNTLVVDIPPFIAQEYTNTPIPVSPILQGKFCHTMYEKQLLIRFSYLVPV